ncbi:hypothetical protein ABZ815_52265 [Nonomuraea sp. NPDC047529]|uniref:hypothetical protein n=1 Tax=Nonomuraea sp. NPDC047529 TaxID=3155623 RepID=UPI0033FE0C9E
MFEQLMQAMIAKAAARGQADLDPPHALAGRLENSQINAGSSREEGSYRYDSDSPTS